MQFCSVQYTIQYMQVGVTYSDKWPWYVGIRDRPRFFDKVGHQTTNASIENKHFQALA